MSTIKPLPSRRNKIHKILLCLLLLVALVLGYLQVHTQMVSVTVFTSLLGILLIVFLVAAVVGRPILCPDCRRLLREGAEHPRAAETYVYYCKRCDVIWDTLIERSDV